MIALGYELAVDRILSLRPVYLQKTNRLFKLNFNRLVCHRSTHIADENSFPQAPRRKDRGYLGSPP